MRRSFKIILLLLLAVMTIGAVFIFYNIGNIKCSLFDFSIIDAMSLLTSVIIGFGLTYLVSISFSKESKKNEIIEEALKDIKDDYGHLMQQFIRMRNNNVTDNFRSYILIFLKNIDKDILILRNLCSDKKYMGAYIKKLINNRADFNYVATGDGFTSGQSVTDVFIEQCSEKYYLVKQTISQCKLELYNI